MVIALAFVLGLLSITFHELGHYEAMKRCGLRIKKVGLIGIPLPFLPSFEYQREETLWCIHPFVVGGYVLPESETMPEDMKLADKLYISASGPIANSVYALFLLGVVSAIGHAERGEFQIGAFYLLLQWGIALLLWVLRKQVSILIPICTIPILFLVGNAIFHTSPMKAVEMGSGGPVAMGVALSHASSVLQALLIAANVSLSIGLCNLLPFTPLDGGHIWNAIARAVFGKKFESVFEWITVPLAAGIILYALSLDGIRVWEWFR